MYHIKIYLAAIDGHYQMFRQIFYFTVPMVIFSIMRKYIYEYYVLIYTKVWHGDILLNRSKNSMFLYAKIY